MAINTIPYTTQSAQTFITLSDNSIVAVPPEADPDAFRRFCEARIKLAASPRPHRRAFVRSSKPSKRINYAARVLAAASPFDAGMAAVATRLDELAAIAGEDTFAGGIEWDDDTVFINGCVVAGAKRAALYSICSLPPALLAPAIPAMFSAGSPGTKKPAAPKKHPNE